MSDALNIALNGLNKTSFQIAKTTSSIVNASSTGSSGDLSPNLVNLTQEKNNYAIEAKVIRAVQETNKSLVDILA